MAIKDLQPRMGNVNIELEITEKGNAREFDKFGKKGKVCNAKAKDESGTIVLTLWNDDVDLFNVGDKVKLTNGYVSEYQGEMQLGTGKFGKMEKIDAKILKSEAAVVKESEKLSQVREKRNMEEDEELSEIGDEFKEIEKQEEEIEDEFSKDDVVYSEDDFVEEEVVEDKKKGKSL